MFILHNMHLFKKGFYIQFLKGNDILDSFLLSRGEISRHRGRKPAFKSDDWSGEFV